MEKIPVLTKSPGLLTKLAAAAGPGFFSAFARGEHRPRVVRRCMMLAGAAVLMLIASPLSAPAQTSCAGRVDARFRPPLPPVIGVLLYSKKSAYVAAQPDGKVLFGGSIQTDSEGNNLVRLNPDGA